MRGIWSFSCEVTSFDFFSLALDESCDVRDNPVTRICPWDNKGLQDYGEAGSNAVNERDDNGERSVHGGKCMHGHAGTEMGQTGRCHNGWLSNSDGEKCRTFETYAR